MIDDILTYPEISGLFKKTDNVSAEKYIISEERVKELRERGKQGFPVLNGPDSLDLDYCLRESIEKRPSNFLSIYHPFDD